MMASYISLSFFLLNNYWRKTRFILQFTVFCIIVGFLIDPRWAPYTYKYIVLVKNVYLVIVGYITVLQFSKLTYNRSLSILLTRSRRYSLYLASCSGSIMIVLLFSLLMDTYIVIFSGLGIGGFFTADLIILGFMNIVLTIVTTHLFSFYIIKRKNIIYGFLLIGFGLIPEWYNNLPLESLLKYLSLVLPPFGSNIIIQQARNMTFSSIFISIIYLSAMLVIGIISFNNRNLTDL